MFYIFITNGKINNKQKEEILKKKDLIVIDNDKLKEYFKTLMEILENSRMMMYIYRPIILVSYLSQNEFEKST